MRLQARYDHHFRATSMRGGERAGPHGRRRGEHDREPFGTDCPHDGPAIGAVGGPGHVPGGDRKRQLAARDERHAHRHLRCRAGTRYGPSQSADRFVRHASSRARREAFALNFIVKQPGQHCQRVDVTAEGGVKSTAQDCVTASGEVPTPRMAVRLIGPEQLSVGEEGLYRVEVRNNGTVPLTNLRIGLKHSASVVPTARPTARNWGAAKSRGEGRSCEWAKRSCGNCKPEHCGPIPVRGTSPRSRASRGSRSRPRSSRRLKGAADQRWSRLLEIHAPLILVLNRPRSIRARGGRVDGDGQ